MIPERDYENILANLARHAPMAIDQALFADPASATPVRLRAAAFPPSKALWNMPEDGKAFIGVRITRPVAHADVLAARLAAIALERGIQAVFLSHIGNCDMQRFGFRVERVCGVDAATRDAFETQLSRFWHLALIVDAEDVSQLG